MLLGARHDAPACADCGATARRDDVWCGDCGARAATTGAAPDVPRVLSPSPRRRVALAAVVAVVAVPVVAGLLRPAPPVDGPVRTGTSLTGRVDDPSGRVSSVDPPSDLERRWSIDAVDGFGADLSFQVGAVGDDAIAIADRVVSLEDGRLLGEAGVLPFVGDRLTDDGLLAVGAEDELLLLTPVGQRPVASVPVVGLTGGSDVVGWVGDTGVVRTFDEETGVPETIGLRRDGTVLWRAELDTYGAAGDGWFIGYGQGRSRLVRAADGATRPLPPEVEQELVGTPVVAGRTAYAPVSDGVVAWDTATLETVWRSTPGRVFENGAELVADGAVVRVLSGGFGGGAPSTSVVHLATADGEVLDEVWVSAGAGGPAIHAPTAALGRDVAVVINGSTDDVVALDEDGVRWRAPVDRALAVAVVGDVVVVVRGTVVGEDTGPRLVGTAEAVVLDGADGRERFRVDVGPVSFTPRQRFVATYDGHVAIDHGLDDPMAAASLRWLDAVDGAEVAADAVLDPVVGTQLLRGAVVLGIAQGAPGAGGTAPVLWQASTGEVVVRDGGVELGPGLVGHGTQPLLGDGVVAIATVDGTLVSVLPRPGEGVAVDAAVRSAVGAPRPRVDVAGSFRPRQLVIDDVVPLAALGPWLLVTDQHGRDDPFAELSRTPLSLADPATGALVWTSEVEVSSAWPVPTERSYFSTFWATGGAVAAADGPVVVVVDGEVVGLDLGDGAVLWRRAFDTGVVGAPVLVADVAVVALAEEVVAVDPRTGEVVWRRGVDGLVSTVAGAGTSTLVATTRGEVHVLDADGAVLETLVGDRGRIDDLAVVDGVVAVLYRDGHVLGFGVRDRGLTGTDEVELP